MSDAAQDLFELKRLAASDSDGIYARRLREVALDLIAAGVRDERLGL